MFDQSSLYYDVVYQAKDYAAEVARLISHFPLRARTVLDVACGTGEHHRFFAPSLAVQGIDLNPVFVQTARAKNPRAEYGVADMRDFRLDGAYDVVCCLFSSIGYCLNLASLGATVQCMADHLAPAGVMLIEPWMTPEVWTPGRLFSDLRKGDGVEVARMGLSRQEGRISVMDFHYMVGKPGQGVESFQEQHRMGLFSRGEIEESLSAAGLVSEFDESGLSGRGLYIARRGG